MAQFMARGRLASIAGRQHGVVSAAQLRALGVDKFWVQRQVTAGWLHPLQLGVYAVGHASVSLRGCYMAAVLACGADAALSHRSAGHLWGLRRASGPIAVTVPRGRAGMGGLEIHRSRRQAPEEFDRVDGIRVTSVARTLLDLATVLRPPELARAIDRAERLELFDLAAIERLLIRARGRSGAAALRQAINGWRPRHTRSELEDRFSELLQATSLPSPILNVLVQGDQHIHEVDAFWSADRLAVQLDGFAYHRTRRDRERDAATDADLELVGYRVVRLTWNEVATHRVRTTRRLGLLISDT
jgi:very-short-patch-repair endonuclease